MQTKTIPIDHNQELLTRMKNLELSTHDLLERVTKGGIVSRREISNIYVALMLLRADVNKIT